MNSLLGTATYNKKGTDEIVGIFGDKRFDYPKNELLLKLIIDYTTEEEDIVLDFFAGSGTTGAVAHKMGRQYILCEQMDYVKPLTVKRLQKVIEGEQGGISKDVNWNGGGSFVYAELMEYNAKFVNQIEQGDSKDKLKTIWEKMQESAFLSYMINPSVVNKEKNSFDELTLDEQKQFLIVVLDKNQLYVNYSDIDDEEFSVSKDDKKLNHQFYSLNKQ
jgi:adenine-specific DNA-methyltransferase